MLLKVQMTRVSSWIFLLVYSFTSSGCFGGAEGPELAEVHGKIVNSSEPVINATVIFLPDSLNAAPAVGVTNEEGWYELRYRGQKMGVPIGPCQVQIQVGGKPVSPDLPTAPPLTYTVSEKQNIVIGNNSFSFDLATLGKPSM